MPLERSDGAVAVSHKYQNLKELQRAMISPIENYIISNILSCSTNLYTEWGILFKHWILEAVIKIVLV